MLENSYKTIFEVLPFEYGAGAGSRLGEIGLQGEWQNEMKPGSQEYNRWVQDSLNKIMGLKLTVDGDLGAQSRSAIRSFQQKHGLAVDGLVGKMTEAAIRSALGGSVAPPKAAAPRFVKNFSGASAECTAAMTRAGKTKAEALAIIDTQVATAIAMLRKAAADLKRGNRSNQTKALFLKIFRVKPEFVPTWLKTSTEIQDRGDVVRVRCLRVADLLASGKIKFFCAINSTNCPDCAGSENAVACSSFGVPFETSQVLCLGPGFWDDMKNNNIDSLLAVVMHEPFHIYFGHYVTEHQHPDGSSVGKFGGIYCITQFVFEANKRNYPQMHKDRCANTAVRSELGFEMEEEDEVNRSSAEYIRWIQSSLNQVSSARLDVDGILGPLTRSAIRSFQQRHGLEVDGIVGPITEQALIDAGAGSPPGYDAPSSPAPSQPSMGSRTKLANQVLNHGNISLWPYSPTGSSSSDGADAHSNIFDTSRGKSARRSGYDNAPGGSINLDTRMLDGMLKMAKTYDMRVTSIAGGSHSVSSLHYSGVAFDVDEINGVHVTASNPYYRAFMQKCRSLGAREVLGPGDAGHDTHVHCAW